MPKTDWSRDDSPRGAVLGLTLALALAPACGERRAPELDLLAEFGPEWVTAETRRLDLGAAEARAALGAGWSIDERDQRGGSFVWAVARRAELDFTLLDRRPAERLLRVRARGARAQRVGVQVNGRAAGELELTQRMGQHSLPLPAALLRSGANRLALLFAELVSVPGDNRALAAAVDWVGFEPLEARSDPAARLDADSRTLELSAPVRVEFVLPSGGAQTLELELGKVEGAPELRASHGAARRRWAAAGHAVYRWLLPAGGSNPAGAVLGLEVLGRGRLELRGARVLGARRRAAPAGRVVLIGIDGLDWDLADRAIDRGAMPNLAALRARGAWASLESVEPTMSIVIWTTIATGRTPQEHGIGGWTAAGERLQTGGGRRVRAIWELASAAGLRCDVVNYWATWPAAPLRGRMVSDLFRKLLFSPAVEDTVYPPGLMRRLLPLLARDPERERAGWQRSGQLRPPADRARAFSASRSFQELFDNAEGYQAAEELSTEVALQLLRQGGSDLTLVLLRAVDVGIHLRWHFLPPELLRAAVQAAQQGALARELEDRLDDVLTDELEPILRATDHTLGRLVEAAGPGANIVVVSDHGFGFTRFGYTHHRNDRPPPGVLVLAGPSAAPGALERASVYDLLPTLARLLGLPLSRELRGRPLESALRGAALPPARFVRTYETSPLTPSQQRPDAAAEQNALEELRALGYIQ
ncbi:MAG TPA: alkaline phosphatase family protein [Acidobacteriota bacterium]